MNDPFRLDGQGAIVTGAASGIGLATVRRLAGAGATVLMTDVRADALEESRRRILAEGLPVVAEAGDISSEADVARMLGSARAALPSIDIAVCNAGAIQTKPLFEISVEECRRLLDVNVLGTFLTARAAARQMIEQGGGGRIICTSSITGVRGSNENWVFYGATKAAIASLAASLALSLARYGITANAVAPGNTMVEKLAGIIPNPENRPEVPLGRMATADQIATTILFLASPAASHITGETLVVDGGQSVGYSGSRPAQPAP